MENRIPLTLDERRKLLHEFHWPKSQFPKKKFVPGVGLKSECDYYKVPIYKDGVETFLKTIKL
jgi:hypothetical protein